MTVLHRGPRDAYRRFHPDEPLLALVLVSRDGSCEYRCLTCQRPIYRERVRTGWKHYARRWNGKRAA